MSNNCLTTKLKDSVNNQELPILGMFQFKIVDDSDLSKLSVLGTNGNLILPSQTISLTGTRIYLNNYNLHNGDIIRFDGKYTGNLIQVDGDSGYHGAELYADDLAYTTMPTCSFKAGVIKGNLNTNVIHNETQYLYLLNANFENPPSVSDIVTVFPNVILQNVANFGLHGDLIDFKAWKNLLSTSVLFLNKDVYGNLYDLIVEWRKVNKMSQQIYLFATNRITFFNVRLPQNKNILFEWTNDSITLTIDGTSTTYDNNGNVIS